MFKKTAPLTTIESELAALTARVDPSRRRVEEARAAHARAVDARTVLIGRGDFTDPELASADRDITEAARKLAGLTDANAALDAQIGAVEARLDAARERVERDALAKGLDETLARTEGSIGDFYKALRIFAEYLSNLPPTGPVAATLAAQFHGAVAPLVADALAEGRAYTQAIRDGTQPLPPKRQQDAAA